MGNVVGRRPHNFDDTQLSAFRPEELNAIDEVLRKNDPAAAQTAASKIREKIGYKEAVPDSLLFLTDFSNAARTRQAGSPAAETGTAMKRCPHCAEDIRAEAVKCRYCGSDLALAPMRRAVYAAHPSPVVQVKVQPSSGIIMRTIKGAVMLMTFAILASVIGTCALCGKAVHDVAQQDQAAQDRVVSAPPESIVTVSSDKLQLDYKANEVNADNLYRGKVLRVTGAVQAIKKDFTDRAYVVLWTTNEFMGAHATFQDEGGLERISVGQHVTLKCVGNNVVMGSPMLKGCVLE